MALTSLALLVSSINSDSTPGGGGPGGGLPGGGSPGGGETCVLIHKNFRRNRIKCRSELNSEGEIRYFEPVPSFSRIFPEGKIWRIRGEIPVLSQGRYKV